MILSPILRPILSPVAAGILGGDSESRWFTGVESTSQRYITFNDVSFSAGSSYAIQFDAVPTGDRLVVFGDSGATSTRVRLYEDGSVEWVAESTSYFAMPSNQVNGSLNRYYLVKSGATLQVFVNDVQAGTDGSTANNQAVEYNQIGRLGSFTPAPAVVANVKIWTGGDKDTGTLIFDMPIDKEYTTSSNTVEELASGNDGTFENLTNGDSILYTLVGNDWVDGSGNELEIAY